MKDIQKDKLKEQALADALSNIEKRFGKGSILNMQEVSNLNVEVIPTGCLALDAALGVGGLPRGRIVEFFGENMSSKSTLSLKAIGICQKMGGRAAYIDAENAFDAKWATKLGVDVDSLIVSQSSSGEEALEIVETLVRSNAIDIIVVDSVAALVPKAELEGEMGDSQVALQARLMSKALRKITGAVNQSKCVVIFINQLRDMIGVYFGNPTTTTGGKALKFYASLRIEIRKIGKIKDGENLIGQRVKAKVVKNKLAAPYKEAEYDLLFEYGIDDASNLIDLAIRFGIIDKKGAWFMYNNENIGQGKIKTAEMLRGNKKLFEEIETKVKEKL